MIPEPQFEIPDCPTLDDLLTLFEEYHRRSEGLYKGDGVWAEGLWRNTSRRILGYIDADYDTPRIVEGLEHLYEYRFDGFYEAGLAAAALTKGSVHVERKYIQPAILLCNKIRTMPASNSPNADGFASFALSLTADALSPDPTLKDVSYIMAARRMMWVNVLDQLPSGTWALQKDQRIWYHSITTRGFIALLAMLPDTFFHHNIKDSQIDKLWPAMLLAVDHIISRMKSDGTFEVEPGSPDNVWHPIPAQVLAMAYTELDLPIFDYVKLAAKGIETDPDNEGFERRGAYIMALGALIKAYRKNAE